MAQFLKVVCSTAGQEQVLIPIDQIQSVVEGTIGAANTPVVINLRPSGAQATALYTITGLNSADGAGAFAKVVNDAIIANPGGVVSTVGYPLTTAQAPLAQSGQQGRIAITVQAAHTPFATCVFSTT
tara:strand:+ start:287 stop:667 length:381 start_codon:yes stop_codon:yes gene_type:complete